MIRITENQDWVIYCLLAVVLIYIVISRGLNKGASLVEMLKSSPDENEHLILDVGLVSLSYLLILSAFISVSIPIVPKFIYEYVNLQGYTLNKFGFTLITLLLFYSIKTLLSYAFYKTSLSSKQWHLYLFSVKKYFWILTLLFCGLCIAQYFYPIDRDITFNYVVVLLILLPIAKLLYVGFNHYSTLPGTWYYKILYICTLQILPYVLIGKFLFF